MKKSIFALLLSAAVLLGLAAGCGSPAASAPVSALETVQPSENTTAPNPEPKAEETTNVHIDHTMLDRYMAR